MKLKTDVSWIGARISDPKVACLVQSLIKSAKNIEAAGCGCGCGDSPAHEARISARRTS
jgi:hypothetical protein